MWCWWLPALISFSAWDARTDYYRAEEEERTVGLFGVGFPRLVLVVGVNTITHSFGFQPGSRGGPARMRLAGPAPGAEQKTVG